MTLAQLTAAVQALLTGETAIFVQGGVVFALLGVLIRSIKKAAR